MLEGVVDVPFGNDVVEGDEGDEVDVVSSGARSIDTVAVKTRVPPAARAAGVSSWNGFDGPNGTGSMRKRPSSLARRSTTAVVPSRSIETR